MKQLGLLESALAREPLAPLSESVRKRVGELLATSPHVDLLVAVSA